MRFLIVALVFFGGVAVVFYAMQSARPPGRLVEPDLSATHVNGVDDADQTARAKDDGAGVDAEIETDALNLPPDNGAPSPLQKTSPKAADQAPRVDRVTGAPSDGGKAEATGSEVVQAKEQLQVLQRSLEAALYREQDEGRTAFGAVAAAQGALEAAVKERGDLSVRIAQVGAENAQLRASMRVKTDELDDDRRRRSERAKQAAAAAGSDRASLQNQIVSLESKIEAATVEQQETKDRLARSEALARELQTREMALDATSRQSIARIEGELTAKGALADRQSEKAASLLEALRGAEAKNRDLIADRDTGNARIARMAARQSLAATRLQVDRLALAQANARADTQQRAAGVALQSARAYADRVEALQKESADARAQIGDMKGTLTQAVAAETTLRAQLHTSSSQQDHVKVELADAQTRNADLAARLSGDGSAWELRLADLRKQNAILTNEAVRIPQLVRDVEENQKRRIGLEQLVATLKQENGGQFARIVALSKERQDQNVLSQAQPDLHLMELAKTRAEKLEGALTSMRAELAQAVQDRSSASDARRSLEKNVADLGAKLRVELQQNMQLMAQVAEAKRDASRPVEVADHHPVKAVEPAPARTVSLAKMPAVPSAHVPAFSALPNAVFAHVLLRYAHGKARPQARAQTLQATLRSLGLDVVDATDVDPKMSGDSVTYFYAQDRSIADQVAQQLAVPAPVQSRGSSSRVPRPGTIEVSIGG